MDMRFVASAGYDLYGGGAGVSVGGRGTIEFEPLTWQLVAIPIQYGFWSTALHRHEHDGVTTAKFKNYVLDQIEDLYGIGKVEVANAYLGDIQAFYSFIPGITPENSVHNFQLVYTDNDSEEISGFWVKSLHTAIMIISWGE
jgi:hypothetical protein